MFRKKNPQVRITVGISGTGGGFERFCRGETDLANASRPIRSTEYARCRENGIKWVAFTVANDGISLVTSRQSTWVDCLTTAELKRIWNTGSKVDNWKDVRAGFPDAPLKLFGAGTDSGTFDFFTEAINGEKGVTRKDYQPSEDDNVLVQGVAGDKGGLGYFGFSYYEQNQDKLNLVGVNSGSGCVKPSKDAIQNGSYKPLSRPLFMYVNEKSLGRPEVKALLEFIVKNHAGIAESALIVPLTDQQLTKAKSELSRAEGAAT
jgi:phosphate transport system substrate-binding protein